MDFRQTAQPTARPAHTPVAPPVPPTPTNSATPAAPEKNNTTNKWLRILSIAILFGIAALIVGIALAFTRIGSNTEAKYINSNKYQAVFLNNGQVYFGKITSLTAKSVVLGGIYYLTQATTTDTKATTANGNYTLVKLGCQQIHDPYDQMIINRDQVTFWENLQSDGKVVSSITAFQKQNPKGPDCTQVSNQTQADSTSGTQGGTGATGTQTPATTTKP